jgi:hypothetical protein
VDESERTKGVKDAADFTVRYSPAFLRTEGRQRRRKGILSGILFMLGAISMVVESIRAWRAGGMVDMGPQMGFHKYPPELVCAVGLLGLAAGGFLLWTGLTTKAWSEKANNDH